MEIIAAGTEIKTITGKTVIVNSLLGEGGNSQVYAADYCGKQMVFKWVDASRWGNAAQSFYLCVKGKTDSGSPGSEFIWPLDITEPDGGSFGYVMERFSNQYSELTDLLRGHTRFASFKTAVDAALNFVNACWKLHNKGYIFYNLSDANFIINPVDGSVRMTDSEEIVPSGTTLNVLGTPRYMAPEIVMGNKMPDKYSDRFSMSSILFMLICMAHPLEGKRYLADCLTPASQKKLYGTDALFIMDKTNHDNAPDPRVQKNVLVIWPCLPDYVQELFQKAFSSTAIQNPNARPTELDWINTLVRFRSEIVRCQCGNEVFTQGGLPCLCESCKKKLEIPFRLEFAQYSIPGLPDSRIYRCQLGPCYAEEALNPMGRVLAKKNDPTVLGIRNMSNRSWNAFTSVGVPRMVAPDEVIPLKDGIQFEYNGTTVIIRKNVA